MQNHFLSKKKKKLTPKRILSYILYFLSIYNTWNSQLIYKKNNFPIKDIKNQSKTESLCVCVEAYGEDDDTKEVDDEQGCNDRSGVFLHKGQVAFNLSHSSMHSA